MGENTSNIKTLRREVVAASAELGTAVGKIVNQAKENSELRSEKDALRRAADQVLKQTVLIGHLMLKENTEYPGNLKVYGEIIGRGNYSLKVNGDLSSYEIKMKDGNIEVAGNLRVHDVTANEITVNGQIMVDNVTAHKVTSKSDILVSQNANVNEITAFGKLEVLGKLIVFNAQGFPLDCDNIVRKRSRTKSTC
ncbi:MAG: hypothetical protein ABSD68_00890 [Candidatus Micrarchaeales archaeon]